jgi:gliding motility-associated-like protein
MSDKDIFKDVFSKKLGNFESEVNPQLWTSISEKMVSTSAAASVGGVSVITKFIIGGVVAASFFGGYFYLKPSRTSVSTERVVKTEKQVERIVEEKELVTKEKISVVTVAQTAPNLNGCGVMMATESEQIKSDLKVNQLKDESIFISAPNLSIVPNNEIVNSNTSELAVMEVSKVKEIGKVNSVVSAPAIVSEESIESLPNVFSPNGDGVYDVFTVKSKGLTDYSLVILDNKNQIVFKTDDPSFSWNGIGMDGNMVESGDYLYYLTAYNFEKKLVSKSSYLKIVK